MSDDAPGPGWWLASDGQWYPQQWEYMSLVETGKGDTGVDLVPAVREKANALGQQGWEMVGFISQGTATKTLPGNFKPTGNIVCMFKRPVRR